MGWHDQIIPIKEKADFGDLWVAFPGDYDTEMDGPFLFLDKEYETWFQDKRANCRHVRIAAENFYRNGNDFIFRTEWHRVPTERDALTYYALYLPEYAVPTEIHFTDPYANGKEYSRTAHRDDLKKRFVLYIECTSRLGKFSFDMFVRFRHDKANFKNASYEDNKTVDFYKHFDPEFFFHLNRTSKPYRNFLYKRNITIQIWETSIT
jgi:hypothetical protein